MKGLMKKMINDCKTNAFFISKHFSNSISKREKTQMYLHLSACPNCKKYYYQQKTLNKKIKYLYKFIENKVPDYQLSAKQKETLKRSFRAN